MKKSKGKKNKNKKDKKWNKEFKIYSILKYYIKKIEMN